MVNARCPLCRATRTGPIIETRPISVRTLPLEASGLRQSVEPRIGAPSLHEVLEEVARRPFSYNVTQIARKVGVSTRTLQRIFRLADLPTPSRWLKDTRRALVAEYTSRAGATRPLSRARSASATYG